MSAGFRRGLADLACRVLQATLPPSLRPWGWAVRCEAASIADDTKALLFVLDSLCGLMPRAVASHLLRLFAPLTEGARFAGGSAIMNIYDATISRPRALGIACAVGAVLLGLTYLAIAGAPIRYLAINAIGLAIGLAIVALLGRTAAAERRWTSAAILAMAGALLATALLGIQVDGATRWVSLGGLAIQPSLILLPGMLVAFSRTRAPLTTVGIVAAAAAMALQPDRAMAGMLALCLATLVILRPERHVVLGLAAGFTGFAVTLVRADALPASRYVDQILYSSFDVHVGAGLAVWVGSALLLVPAIVGWRNDAGNRTTYVAFGAVWAAAILAAALGNYPTPVVGYGGSAIIGYVLSLLALPKRAEIRTGAAPQARSERERMQSDQHLLVGLA